MADPTITWKVSPTGGIVILGLSSTATTAWSLSRAVSGSSGLGPATTLYSGNSLASPNAPGMEMPYVDSGDGTSQPLNQSLAYVWTFTTPNGTASTDAITPAVAISIEPEPITSIIIKAIQSGVNSLLVPEGFLNTPTVQHSMPVNGDPSLPMICVNEDLIQMEHTGIGAGVDPDMSINQFAVPAIARRRINVSVITTTVEERAFYKSAIIGLWRSALGPLLGSIGQDATQSYQASDTQDVGSDSQPGFYVSEIMLEFSGTFNVQVVTNYTAIETIIPEPNNRFV